MRTKQGSTKIIFIDRYEVEPFICVLEIPARLTISNANKRMINVMKEKLNHLVEEYKQINSKPRQVLVFSIWYITNSVV